MDQATFTAFIESTKANIDEYGVSIMGVINSHAYTIGMANLGLPDVIITGNLNASTAQHILNELVRQWKTTGVAYGDNFELIQGKCDDASLKTHIRAIAPDKDFFDTYVRQALNFYEEHPDYVKVASPMFAQILWPDNKGTLPTEAGYLSDDFVQHVFSAVS